MLEIRFHGRGGQGAVIASKILAGTLFKAGKKVMAFPQFGVERRGAPVEAYLRVQDKEETIFLRSNIYTPDVIVVLDPSLIEMVDVFGGMKNDSIALINTTDKLNNVKVPEGVKVVTVDASGIALKYKLGSRTQPIVNTAILGAFIKITGIGNIQDLLASINEEITTKTEENQKAAREAYEKVTSENGE